MKKLYVIEKSTGKILISDSECNSCSLEFIEIDEELFSGVRLYSVTEKSKDIRFRYNNINPDEVYTITYSELLGLLLSNNEE